MTQVIAASVLAASIPSALVERAPLADALTRVAKVVEKRSTIPVLSHVKLSGTGSAIVALGTDLDMTIRVPIAGAVDSRFSATAPADMLAKVLKAQASEYVEITAEPARAGVAPAINSERPPRLVLDFEGPRSTLDGRDVADFPDMAEKDFTHSFGLGVDVLRRALESTDFAISSEETRYYLNGVFVHTVTEHETGEDVLRFVATDGHRLSRVSIPAPAGSFSMPPSIIPRKAVKVLLGELKRKALKNTGTVFLDFAAGQIRFRLPGCVEITTKAIDGSFPDYARVTPLGNPHRVAVDSSAMAAAVKGVLNVSSERGRAVKLSILGFGGLGEIGLSVTNPDAGVSSASVSAAVTGANGTEIAVDIGFNGTYLLDMLARAPGAAEIMLGDRKLRADGPSDVDPGAPALFRSAEAEDPGFRWLGVLMPMRV